MPHRFFNRAASACRMAGVGLAIALPQWALAADPFASNNGFYPQDKWTGQYRTLNLNYPEKAPAGAQADWLRTAPRAALTTATAAAYTAQLKKFVEPAMRAMVEQPSAWNPQQVGWYDMPWQADGAVTGER